MKNTFLFAILFSGCVSSAYAQTPDLNTPKEKEFEHIVGVQVNGLIKQVFNFNNSMAQISNPYLVTYNINSKKTGYGLRLGVGYNYSSSGSNDGINQRTTDINDMNLRLGFERAYKLSDKWSAGVGVDLLYNNNNDKTKAITISSDTLTINTTTTIASYGAGVMGWLRYSITKNILIGTETSFNYTTGKQKITVETVFAHFNNNQPAVTLDNKVAVATFNLPIVFYLAVKF